VQGKSTEQARLMLGNAVFQIFGVTDIIFAIGAVQYVGPECHDR
jgi:hypothetical protein